MSEPRFRDACAISGIGWSALSKASGRTPAALATEAALAAIADAGLEPAEIDGLVTLFWGARDTPAPSEMVAALGLPRCRLSHCDAGGGAWACSAVMAAALAVHAGICRHVLVYRGANMRSAPPPSADPDYWPSGQRPWSEPFGAVHAATLYGPHVAAWMHAHGLSNSDFADLAVMQRAHARLNRKAMMQAPMSVDDHQQSPWIIRPFRLLDCSIFNDGAMALVVSASDAARGSKHGVVTIRAALGGSSGAPVRAWGSGDYWTLNAEALSRELYAQAGISVADIDIAQLYDPFTGMALMHVEQFGLAAAGQAARAVAEGEFGLDGRIALNSSGGHLSEGNLAGLGHVIEAVQQLRAGGVRDDLCDGEHSFDRSCCRQVRSPHIALVAGECGDSGLILAREA